MESSRSEARFPSDDQGNRQALRDTLSVGKSDCGRIEYARYNKALAASIDMTASRLLEENGRGNFITRRLDRVAAAKPDPQKKGCRAWHGTHSIYSFPAWPETAHEENRSCWLQP